MAKHRTIRVAVSLSILLFFFAQPAQADSLGQQQVFSIDAQYDSKGRTQVNTTLQYVSQHAYFYVADDYWRALSIPQQQQLINTITATASEFDSRIYPLETAFFGSEPNPGIDGDPRLTFVLASLRPSIGGYFDSTHEYPTSLIPHSNQREMIFLNTYQFSDTRRIFPFIAHEFHHLISFNQKERLRSVSEEIWLNELRSEYAISLLGYNTPYEGSTLERRAVSLMEQSSDSLTEWRNAIQDYGHVALFAQYVADRYSPKVIGDTATSSGVGIASFNEALLKNGFNTTFQDIFANWMATNHINDTRAGVQFSYTLPGLTTLHIPPTQIFSVNQEANLKSTFSIKDWEQRWYDIQGLVPGQKSTLRVIFDSPAVSTITVAYLVYSSDGSVQYKTANLSAGIKEIQIPNVGNTVTRVIVMPFKHERTSAFSSNESLASVTMTILRSDPKDVPVLRVTPEQYGLKEGDFIRAQGDYQVYIINNFGYKRTVLSPAICLQYGHLGARGCFGAVREVAPAVRDAFQTSPYYSNGETFDGKVYQLIETGEDSAYLQLVTHPFDNSVFYINNREQNTYTR